MPGVEKIRRLSTLDELRVPSDPSPPLSVASSATQEEIPGSEIGRIAAHVQDPG